MPPPALATSKAPYRTRERGFYGGILMDGGLLSIDPVYFSITGGRERWLYRVARKHAGGGRGGGFSIPLPTLFEKSGAEGTYRRFKFEIQAIGRRNDLPEYSLKLVTGRGEPALRMCRRDPAAIVERTTRKSAPAGAAKDLPLFTHPSAAVTQRGAAGAAGEPDVGRPGALGAYSARLRALRPQRFGNGAAARHAPPHPPAHPRKRSPR